MLGFGYYLKVESADFAGEFQECNVKRRIKDNLGVLA